MKCISFSLYGNDSRYTIGAIKNAILASRYFPFDDGFIVQFWIGTNSTVDDSILTTLERIKGVQINIVSEPENNRAKLWRYYAFSDAQFDAVICRDSDARLSYRDRLAFEDWQQSGLEAHIIKDHPSGHDYPISAGMFAAKTKNLTDMTKLINAANVGDYYTTDQDFLASTIYPRIKDSVLIHDPYYNTKVEGDSIRTTIPFDAPTPLSHIGAALNADDTFYFDVDRKLSIADGYDPKYHYESNRWGK